MSIEEVSRLVFAIVIGLLIFLIGIQVGKRTTTNPQNKFHLVGEKNHGNTAVIQITLKICPASKPEINV